MVVVVVVAGEVWSGFEIQRKGQPVSGLGGLEALVFDGVGERAVAACWGFLFLIIKKIKFNEGMLYKNKNNQIM